MPWRTGVSGGTEDKVDDEVHAVGGDFLDFLSPIVLFIVNPFGCTQFLAQLGFIIGARCRKDAFCALRLCKLN